MTNPRPHYVLGAGRWGCWLARRMRVCGLPLVGILGERPSARRLANELSIPLSSEPADAGAIVWVCVADAAIRELYTSISAWRIAVHGVIHASGTHPLVVMPQGHSGVCWPVQSITAEVEPDWHELPFVIESSDAAFAKTIQGFAANLSSYRPVIAKSTADRQCLHLAATLTQNFGNLLWTLAEEVLAEADLDYRDLLPLVKNHLTKLSQSRPSQLQTGPAIREDHSTIARHRELLSENTSSLEVYDLLTRTLQDRRLDKPHPT